MTRFVLDLTQGVEFRVFTLSDPYRVVIDLPEVGWRLPARPLPGRNGLLDKLRYNLFKPGNSRVVLNVTAPVAVKKAFMLRPHQGRNHRLVLDLVPIGREAFLKTARLTKRAVETASSASADRPTTAPARGGHAVSLPPPPAPARPTSPPVKRAAFVDWDRGDLRAPRGTPDAGDGPGRYRMVVARETEVFVRVRERVLMVREPDAQTFPCDGKKAFGSPVPEAFAASPCSVAYEGEELAQAIPESSEPGRLEKRFETPTVPKSAIEPIVPGMRGDVIAPDKAKEFKFELFTIMIHGSTAYAESEFLPLYEKYLGQEISLATVYEIANAITVKYRNDGYILSRAIVPPQRIRHGVVIIQIVEGYINSVIIEGERRDVRNLIDTYGDKITRSRPLHIDDLERYLLLTNDLPGVTAKSVLRPSKDEPGASEMVLKLDYKPVDASISLDNLGTRFAGPKQLTATLGANSVAGLGERTRLRYITTGVISPGDREELKFFDVNHEEILWSEGTKLSVGFTSTRSEPGYTLKQQEVKSKSKTTTLTLSHPFIRSRAQNLSARLGFTHRDSNTDLLSQRLAKDRIRVASVGATYDFVDGFRGITLVGAELSQGLNIFNPTDKNSADLSRATARNDFTKVTADVSRLQNVYGNLNVLAAVTGQYSAHELLSSEEFGVGGTEFGRGYDPSEITGDHGVAAKVELQFGDTTDWPFLQSYQLFGFYDFGAVFSIKDIDQDTLASMGLGVRFNLTDWSSGFVEYAKPLTRQVAAQAPNDANEHRIFFNLTARY